MTGPVKPANGVDVKALIAGMRMPERVVPVCLRLDLAAEHTRLDAELADLAEPDADVINSPTRRRRAELAEQIADLESQMRAATVGFRVRALPHRAWSALLAAHPARKGEDGKLLRTDGIFAVNVDEFFPAAIVRCVVEPALDADDWEALIGSEERGLSDRQYAELVDAVWQVNRADIDVPFSHAASRTNRSSGRG